MILLLVVILVIGIPVWYVYGARANPSRPLFGNVAILDLGSICGGFTLPSTLESFQGLVQMFWSRLCGR